MIIYGVDGFTEKTILEAVQKQEKENIRLSMLYDYYRGEQAIKSRFYADSTKPNNRICSNLCKSVSDFLAAYLVGTPIQYEGASRELLEAMEYNDDSAEEMRAVLYMNVYGMATQLFYCDADGRPRYSAIHPMESVVFLRDDLQRDITGYMRIVKRPDDVGGYFVTTYTATHRQDFVVDEPVTMLTPVSDKIPHFWRDVPVSLYENNTELQGSFEQAISLQDALNKVYSDSVNDFESFADAYLVLSGLNGTTQKDIQEMKENRVIMIPDRDSGAKWLTKDNDTSRIQQLQSDLRAAFLENCSCPDWRTLSGEYGNVSGVALRLKFLRTEILAGFQERAVKKAVQRKVELLYNILELTNRGTEYTAVKPVFTRSFLIADGQDSGLKEGNDLV